MAGGIGDLDREADLATAQPDLILVFGGDGSILHVARRLGANPIPVLGVNMGQLGYLAGITPDMLPRVFAEVCRGECTVVDVAADDDIRKLLDVLAEFGYGGTLLPSFPKWVIDGTRPTRAAWLLKEMLLPPVYWGAMLKGREWMAKPEKLTVAAE